MQARLSRCERSVAGSWVVSPAARLGGMATDRDVVLVIADISGYTRFLVSHGKAQTHGDMIVGALLEAIMAEVEPSLQVVELEGYAEALPVPDESADFVISNGLFNLCPDKPRVLAEMQRVLKPGGRLLIGDIIVQKAVPEAARGDIDLWTG